MLWVRLIGGVVCSGMRKHLLFIKLTGINIELWRCMWGRCFYSNAKRKRAKQQLNENCLCCQWDFMPQKAAFKNQSFYTPMNDFPWHLPKKVRYTLAVKLNSIRCWKMWCFSRSECAHHCAFAAPSNCHHRRLLLLFEEDCLSSMHSLIREFEIWKFLQKNESAY